MFKLNRQDKTQMLIDSYEARIDRAKNTDASFDRKVGSLFALKDEIRSRLDKARKKEDALRFMRRHAPFEIGFIVGAVATASLSLFGIAALGPIVLASCGAGVVGFLAAPLIDKVWDEPVIRAGIKANLFAESAYKVNRAIQDVVAAASVDDVIFSLHRARILDQTGFSSKISDQAKELAELKKSFTTASAPVTPAVAATPSAPASGIDYQI